MKQIKTKIVQGAGVLAILIGCLCMGLTACEKDDEKDIILNNLPDNVPDYFSEKTNVHIVTGVALWINTELFGYVFMGCGYDPSQPCMIIITASSSATSPDVGVYVGSVGGDSTIGYVGYKIDREWESGDTTFYELNEIGGLTQDTVIYNKPLDDFIETL